MGEDREELVQCRGARCKGLEPKPRSEFYAGMRSCKACHDASALKYRHSAKGRLAKRRRDVLLKQAKAALRSGALAQVYPCEFVDGNCEGGVAAHFPDAAVPEEFFWFCTYHRELISRLKVPPSYKGLALLVDRWK